VAGRPKYRDILTLILIADNPSRLRVKIHPRRRARRLCRLGFEWEAVISNELGWISVLGGLVMGLVMGIKFQREEWLAAYGAFPVAWCAWRTWRCGAWDDQHSFAQSAARLHLGCKSRALPRWHSSRRRC
jgi:hypothetical protein